MSETIFVRDGDMWCAHRHDFVNLQESNAGFGKTQTLAEDDLVAREGRRTVIFFRKDHFYPVQLCGVKPAADECADHAALNPGTLRVEDALTSQVLWSKETVQ